MKRLAVENPRLILAPDLTGAYSLSVYRTRTDLLVKIPLGSTKEEAQAKAEALINACAMAEDGYIDQS